MESLETANNHRLELPERIKRLEPLAYNLWWSWNPEARYLFRRIDRFVWERVGENPVLFLYTVDPERLKWASFDAEFLKTYDRVMSTLDEYLDSSATTWVSRNAPQLANGCAAYFSAEFGLYRSLPIYSGGLGVLAGDHIKEASDLGLPLVAVSLLYRQGYLSQRLTPDGWQQDVTAEPAPARRADDSDEVRERRADPDRPRVGQPGSADQAGDLEGAGRPGAAVPA